MEHEPVRHILLGRFRPGTSDESIEAVFTAFRDTCRKIEGIVSFEYGTNNSPEGRNHGMTHVITLTFAGAQERDAYLVHAEHRKHAAWLGTLGIVEDLLVIDYIPRS
jgi:hypothetical protein